MKITCQACGAKYTIADDKVSGRKVKIRCKGCATPIVVDGQGASADAEIQGVADTGSDAINADAMPDWSVNLSDTDSRTMSVDELVAGWKTGLVTADAYVWKDGMADWIPILECDELKNAIDAASRGGSAPKALPPKAQAVASKAPAARLAAARPQGTADLFGSVDLAGGESDVATGAGVSVPNPGGRVEEKPTGARNENSVLFSLDALKAGFVGGKAEPPAPPGRAPARPAAAVSDDPFNMGSGAGNMFGGAGFNLSDNQALLTAPAPEPPPPPPQPMPSLDLGALAQSPQASAPSSLATLAKNKKVMLGAAGGLLVLVIGIAVALSGGKKDETASVAGEASARSGTESEPSKKEETKPAEEEKKAEPEAKKEEETKPEEPKKEAPAAEAKTSDAPKSTGGTSKAPPAKKEEPAAPSAAGPFSKASAISALGSASSAASSCKKPGGPTGSGKVQVTFAPSGRVTTASVQGGPFAGTAVGGCVAAVFRRAKVPPFSGSPVTVAKSFSIN